MKEVIEKSTAAEPVQAAPYSRPELNNKLILRDELAIDRTRLANERTILAWLRTSMMMLVSGITLVKLFEGVLIMELTGGVLIPLSLLMAIWGTQRYFQARRSIEASLRR